METAMERWRIRHRLAVLGLVLPLIIVSCSRPAPYRRVNLTPVPQQVPTLAPAGELPALRLAVAAILSPQSTAHDYKGLIAYLSNKLGRPLRLVQGSTYAETNEMLRTGQVDLGFLCTGAYVQGQRDFDMELLVIPQVNGEPVYRSYIVVRAGSSAQRWQDLRGGVFAFTDPLSL
ncbi:MAG: PhnD/SsuA/transferrin family substrate-binding protein, partial [Anaerolineae bacterium]